jgi:ParB family chromosome partitioning protein
MSAERVFAGTYITEVDVRDRALSWVPEVMRFAAVDAPITELDEPVTDAADAAAANDGANYDDQTPPRAGCLTSS